jgi:hypothetical protein
MKKTYQQLRKEWLAACKRYREASEELAKAGKARKLAVIRLGKKQDELLGRSR